MTDRVSVLYHPQFALMHRLGQKCTLVKHTYIKAVLSSSDFSSLLYFRACFNRACWIHPLDSATNTTMGKPKQLSIDLKGVSIDLNNSGLLEPLQSSYRPKDRQLCKFKVHGMVVSLSQSGRQHKLSPAAGRTLVRTVKSQPKTTKKCSKTGISIHRDVFCMNMS